MLLENEHVKELLAIMAANKLPERKELFAVVNQAVTMEQQLKAMVAELQAIRKELAEAQIKNHPVKNALQNAIISMQQNILELRDALAGLKQNIIEGCKNAVTAFKENGLSALRNVADFFKIRPALEILRDNLDRNIRQDEAAIAKVEAMSTEFHETALHLKNMVRVVAGKEAIREAKPVGKLAKAVEAPYHADRACLTSVRQSVSTAIDALDRLEKTDRKPPILETLKKLNEKIALEKKETPVHDRLRQATQEER